MRAYKKAIVCYRLRCAILTFHPLSTLVAQPTHISFLKCQANCCSFLSLHCVGREILTIRMLMHGCVVVIIGVSVQSSLIPHHDSICRTIPLEAIFRRTGTLCPSMTSVVLVSLIYPNFTLFNLHTFLMFLLITKRCVSNPSDPPPPPPPHCDVHNSSLVSVSMHIQLILEVLVGTLIPTFRLLLLHLGPTSR